MWIGNSLLFNWLDRRLESPSGATQTQKPIGSIWLLHSGGFYYVEKTLLEGQRMPKLVHWFKWQAYTTWLTGILLMIVVYWAGGRAVMADAGVSSLSEHSAMLVGVAAVFGGWALYELMNRFVAPRFPIVSAVLWIGGLIAISIALTQLINEARGVPPRRGDAGIDHGGERDAHDCPVAARAGEVGGRG